MRWLNPAEGSLAVTAGVDAVARPVTGTRRPALFALALGTFCIGVLGGASLLSLGAFLPRSAALDGASVMHELRGLAKPRVWLMMAVAALGISSIFAVYTFIGPFVTDLLML